MAKGVNKRKNEINKLKINKLKINKLKIDNLEISNLETDNLKKYHNKTKRKVVAGRKGKTHNNPRIVKILKYMKKRKDKHKQK